MRSSNCPLCLDCRTSPLIRDEEAMGLPHLFEKTTDCGRYKPGSPDPSNQHRHDDTSNLRARCPTPPTGALACR